MLRCRNDGSSHGIGSTAADSQDPWHCSARLKCRDATLLDQGLGRRDGDALVPQKGIHVHEERGTSRGRFLAHAESESVQWTHGRAPGSGAARASRRQSRRQHLARVRSCRTPARHGARSS